MSEARRIARRHGLDLTAAEIEAAAADWRFECFPDVPPSECILYDGWRWLIDSNDFAAWCERERARRDDQG